MGAVKVDFTIPKELDKRLRQAVGGGQRSTFVANAISEKLEALERQRMELELERGYKEMASEHDRIVELAFDTQAKVVLGGS